MYLLTSFRLSSIWNSYFGIIKGYLFFLKGQMKDTLIISHVLITLVTCMYCDCSALKQEKRYRFSLFKLANWSTSSGKQALGSRAHSTPARGHTFASHASGPHTLGCSPFTFHTPNSAGFVTSNLLQTDTLMCLPLLVIILFALLPFVIYVMLFCYL